MDFDLHRLEQFLLSRVENIQGPMTLERIKGGQSNPTFFVDFPGRRFVLRKQPAADLLPSAHAIDREFRVMQALTSTSVPVPKLVLFHEDRSIIGTPFYLMERMDGRVIADYALPGMTPAERRAIYLSMADTMGQLHRVDWAGIGLSDFGRPGNYFRRQLARWSKQWAISKTRDDPRVDALTRWLYQRIPFERETTVCHGDFRLGNLMIHPTEPRVIGVLDWELSTLGHPLADVAFNAMAWWILPTEYGGIRGLDLQALGIPSQQDYLAHYYEVSGIAEQVTAFHFAFALFRMAVIFEGIASRAANGNAASHDAAQVGRLSRSFVTRALEFVDDQQIANVSVVPEEEYK